jgi:hypothetical protein
MRDLRNSMVSLGKTVLDVKLIRKILRSLPERFRIKVTTIEESKDLEEMKIKELVGSLQTYELSLPPVKKVKTIPSRLPRRKPKSHLKTTLRMKKKQWQCWPKILEDRWGMINSKSSLKDWRSPPESLNLRKLRRKIQEVPRYFECSGFGHIRADCENLKQGKWKVYNVTLNDESEEEESPNQGKFLAFVAPHVEEEDSYCSDHSDEDGE